MLKTLDPKLSDVSTAWAPALVTTAVWIALGLSAVAWGLALWPSDRQPLAVSVASLEAAPAPLVQAADIARVLGDSSAAPSSSPVAAAPTAVRMSLLGVAMAGKTNAIAVISLDGQPAKAFHVGATVSSGLVLQAVTSNQVLLGAALKSPTLSTLELPKRP
jgi:general secretion pathway protein C